MNTHLLALLLGVVFASVPVGASNQGKQTKIVDKSNSLRHLVPDRWWEKAAAIKIVILKKNMRYAHEISIDPVDISKKLGEIKAQSFRNIYIVRIIIKLKGISKMNKQKYQSVFKNPEVEVAYMDIYNKMLKKYLTKN